jgi:hypothetical protein
LGESADDIRAIVVRVRLVNSGLWTLTIGEGGSGLDPSTLYLTAVINGGQSGLRASISTVPEPSSAALASIGETIACALAYRRRAASISG